MTRDNTVLIAQLQSMYPQVKFLFLGVIALTVVLLNIFWDKVDQTILISWALASSFIIVCRSFFVIYSIKHLSLKNAHVHAFIFAIGCLASGFTWAFTSFLFLDPKETVSLIVIVILLLGSTAGSLVTLSAYLPAFYAYNISILIPLAWVLIDQNNPDITWIGFLVIVFLIAMIGYSHSVNRSLKQYIALRFHNEALLEEAKTQRDFAQKANREKSQYLAATSHDLRQPLHALQLYLSNLKRLQTSDEQQLLMQKSVDTSENLNQLLAALMDVSRLDSGEVTVNKETIDLNRLINSLAQEFQPDAQRQNIQFLVSFTQCYVLSDKLLLMRCIRNLICNAFDHAKANRIEILVSDIDEEQVQLSIVDDGVGINYQEKEKVFSEFYQLKNPERDRNKGLGLGLAIVKKLSKILKHPLELETSPDNGCKFTLTLERSKLLPSDDNEDTSNNDISGLFIVMVEDDPLICEAMSMTMKHWGCEVLIHQTTQALMSELKQLNYTAPDIIIADYRLKHNQTGIQAVEQVRQYFNRQIPAIIVSGDITQSITNKLAQLNCEFHQKPVTPEKLKQSIAKLTALNA